MVLMAMGEYESLHLVSVLKKVSDVGNDQVDPVHVVFRERKTTVDYDDRILVLECSDIHTDGFQSAKRYDLQF